MNCLLLRTLINTISRSRTGLPCPKTPLGKNRQPALRFQLSGTGTHILLLCKPRPGPPLPPSLFWGKAKIITILSKQFYHSRIATQLQITAKNRLISIDLIKINSRNYGDLVAAVPSGNSAEDQRSEKLFKNAVEKPQVSPYIQPTGDCRKLFNSSISSIRTQTWPPKNRPWASRPKSSNCSS